MSDFIATLNYHSHVEADDCGNTTATNLPRLVSSGAFAVWRREAVEVAGCVLALIKPFQRIERLVREFAAAEEPKSRNPKRLYLGGIADARQLRL